MPLLESPQHQQQRRLYCKETLLLSSQCHRHHLYGFRQQPTTITTKNQHHLMMVDR